MTRDRLDLVLEAYFRPTPAPAGLAARVLAAAREVERVGLPFKGRLAIRASARGIVGIAPGGRSEASSAAARRLAARARTELAEYLAGRRTFFSVPVDLTSLPVFQRRVLEAAREIPFGEARPYAWVAHRIGRPRAVRAVGTALARNPVPLVIPCHRVVRSDGTPGEYALGAAMKRRLHALEEATPRLEGCTSTRIVCRVGCAHGRRMRPANRIVFASVGDARALGYRACRVCRPAAAA